ncbi:hypothetical protein ACOMHN_027997 [Nucella lapillus]
MEPVRRGLHDEDSHCQQAAAFQLLIPTARLVWRQVQEEALRKTPQQTTKTQLDSPPTQDEMKAYRQAEVPRGSWSDGLPTEVCQLGGDAVLEKLAVMLQACSGTGVVPRDLCDAVIVSVQDVQEQGREISLLELHRHNTTVYC